MTVCEGDKRQGTGGGAGGGPDVEAARLTEGWSRADGPLHMLYMVIYILEQRPK